MERIGVGFNPNITLAEAATYARLAEVNGYDSFWVHENPFIKDAVSLLSSAISTTKRIKLASGCVSVITRHPLLAATTFAALNDMSGGRIIMGVGLGGFPWLPKIGVKVFPVHETKPLKRIKEFLTITKPLLEGESVSLDGEFFKVSDLKLETKPSARPPLYLATFGPQTLAMAARMTDGVIISPAMMTPEETAKKVQVVNDAETSGKKIDIASYVITAVSQDEEQARKLMKSYYFLQYQVADVLKPELFAPYGVDQKDLEQVREAWRRKDLATAAKAMPDGVLDALTLTGNPNHCLEGVERYRKAGVRLPIIMPIGDVKAAIQAFATS